MGDSRLAEEKTQISRNKHRRDHCYFTRLHVRQVTISLNISPESKTSFPAATGQDAVFGSAREYSYECGDDKKECKITLKFTILPMDQPPQTLPELVQTATGGAEEIRKTTICSRLGSSINYLNFLLTISDLVKEVRRLQYIGN